MKILITGTGFLGNSLYELFQQNHYNVLQIGRKDVNLTDLNQVSSFFKGKKFSIYI